MQEAPRPKKIGPSAEKAPDVSGVYRAEEDFRNQPRQSGEEIAQEAAKKGRFKKSFHQSYENTRTPEEMETIRKATQRMLGGDT
ncbi:MAG: hypothetical protein UY70_C0004G0021 [Candidatus Kaiserbacteria bacterium GW2011_GWB1_52_6]|uniref:Uncharacterized protein n=3 Tax=Candidatus Kaiseribacteriota TaxID=1752734 RepID=A0A0G2ACY0_9BACT|nr:MAG: hypothetical protein UY67_C0020G0020 [Candidatus Kaiserbacteria bacterium GW2011_GWA2_52_12]KKW28037.1 MAG: hypothetical protein UY70_C0004G0021 [Candidatus Kaiserbacteria bacterium GW2011_GWB1_52_6]KKW30294.1 MAG: hypothetical protein UY74_C0045G0010 [Candidatus Kaiserbacteria bacterium GW2011_GWC2_52_8b]